MSERVTTQIRDGAAWITLDDGKVNALSTGFLGEIRAALDEAETAGAVAVLRGRDGIFSAGFDLATFGRGPEATLAMLRAGAELIVQLLEFPRPVVTVCTGHAYPMGAFLMLASDVRFAVGGEWRIGLNETAIGLTVPRFAVELARHRLAPQGFARVSTAALFDPMQAQRLGYVDRVTDADRIDAETAEEVERLGALDAAAFVETKSRINARACEAVRGAIESELPRPVAA